MKWLALIALLASTPALADKKLEYFGRDQAGAAVIDHGQGRHSATVGDEVPGWGRVKSIDDDKIVVERVLSDDERAALVKRKLIPFASEQTVVERADRRIRVRSPQRP
jgi:hypothetical protein